MHPGMVIVDDFYTSPEKVLDLAKNCKYVPKGALSQNFAGIESFDSFFTKSIVEKLERIVNSKIDVDPNRNAFGRFRLACGEDKRRTKVHSDNTDWTAVVYLTPDEHCQGGTQFFKHLPTGLEGPPTDEWLEENKMSRNYFNSEIILKDSLNESKWEITGECKMKFNRCLILQGSKFFHGSSNLFGDSFGNARLTQNFFFNVISL